MNLLKESIAQRRASEPATFTCVAIGAQSPGVVVALWPNESWVFPWTYLVSAHCTPCEGDAQLVLTFTTQRVTAEGQNLTPVMEAIAGFRLSLLRELPVACRPPGGSPFISHLSVRPANQAEVGGPTNVQKNPASIPKINQASVYP